MKQYTDSFGDTITVIKLPNNRFLIQYECGSTQTVSGYFKNRIVSMYKQ